MSLSVQEEDVWSEYVTRETRGTLLALRQRRLTACLASGTSRLIGARRSNAPMLVPGARPGLAHLTRFAIGQLTY